MTFLQAKRPVQDNFWHILNPKNNIAYCRAISFEEADKVTDFAPEDLHLCSVCLALSQKTSQNDAAKRGREREQFADALSQPPKDHWLRKE